MIDFTGKNVYQHESLKIDVKMTQDHDSSQGTVLIIMIERKDNCFVYSEWEKNRIQCCTVWKFDDACKTWNITFQSIRKCRCSCAEWTSHFLAPMILFLHFLKFYPATQREASVPCLHFKILALLISLLLQTCSTSVLYSCRPVVLRCMRLSLCACLSRATAPSSVPPGKSAGRAGKGSFQKWRRGQPLLQRSSRSFEILPFWSVAYC